MADIVHPPGPCWVCPVEIAKAQATVGSLSDLLKAEARGALFHPHAAVFLRNGRFMAELRFIDPLGPEKEPSVVLMLSPPPRENA